MAIFKKSKLLLIFLLASCNGALHENNRNFLDKYQSEVDRINTAREKMVQKANVAQRPVKTKTPIWQSPSQIMGVDGTFNTRTAYVDTTKFKIEKKDNRFLPNKQTYEQGKLMQSQTPEIFNISYRTENYPQNYRRAMVSFDDIKIPQFDYYGINSSLGKKNYKNINNTNLQKNIDYINSYFNKDRRQINLTLLKEREQIRRQKMAELFQEKPEEVLDIVEQEAIDEAIDNIAEDIVYDIENESTDSTIDSQNQG